ncbi:putative Cysteine protease [Hyphomicrobiales bacterium]|nr:putative Cysteine protease [Hyphomicrobiales bacterium]CAH1665789.1 putative Cysteine protease [Hyphomicrobiales bacterium]
MISKLSFTYRETDTFTIEDATAVQPNKTRVSLKDILIDTRMSPNPENGFYRNQQTSIAFPRLQVGSTVDLVIRQHFAATRGLHDMPYAETFSTGPVRSDAYELELVSDRPLVWRAADADDFTIEASDDRKRLTMRQKIGARYHARIGEPQNSLNRRAPRLVAGHSDDPQEVFGPLTEAWNRIITSPLPPKVAGFVNGLAGRTEVERINAIMTYIHSYYRYLGDWQASERGHQPFDLATIVSNGYGDCKDLSVLLVAMLNAAGVDARPALVERGAYAQTRLLAGGETLDHAIVQARVNGEIWWLDPTNPTFSPGLTPSDIADRWSIVFNKDGKVSVEQTTLSHPAGNIQEYQFVLNLAADGRSTGTVAASYRGATVAGIAASDMKEGPSATDRMFCAEAADQCDVKREILGYIAPDRYDLYIKLKYQNADPISGEKLVLRGRPNSLDIENYQKYISDENLNDLNIGPPVIKRTSVVWANSILEAVPKSCEAKSSWIDFSASWDKTSEGAPRSSSVMTIKTTWLSHEDIISDEFKTFLAAARTCSASLKQVVTLK